MKFSEALAFTLLAWGMPPAMAVETPSTPLASKFAAIGRPALSVKAPGRAVLLAGTVLPNGRLVSVGERGVVALSDDGGAHWRQAAAVPTSVTLTAVKSAPAGDVFAVGHGGVVLRSHDAGEHWTQVTDGEQLAAAAVAHARELKANATPAAGRMQRDAAQLASDGPDKPLTDIAFQDAKRGVVVGAYNLVFVTDDGGATWQCAMDRVENPKGLHLYAVAVQGNTWMLAGEQGTLLRSDDSGRTFTRLSSPYQGSWFALVAGGAGEWTLAGLRGHAFYSGDDGQTWQQIEGAPPASFVSASQLPDGSVLLGNQAGLLFKARGTAPMTPVTRQPLPPLSQAIALKDGSIIALGFAGATLVQGAAQ
jgi:photosystem II stability/assembly factor-like uncharacterized protein